MLHTGFAFNASVQNIFFTSPSSLNAVIAHGTLTLIALLKIICETLSVELSYIRSISVLIERSTKIMLLKHLWQYNLIKFFFIFQNLSDIADASQGLIFYIVLAGSLYVYSWLGEELSSHVSKSDNLTFRFILYIVCIPSKNLHLL
jgi:hypothetical protein